MTLTIRRKLFLAFMGVVALPLATFIALSVSYFRRQKAALEEDFVASARVALESEQQAQRVTEGLVERELQELSAYATGIPGGSSEELLRKDGSLTPILDSREMAGILYDADGNVIHTNEPLGAASTGSRRTPEEVAAEATRILGQREFIQNMSLITRTGVAFTLVRSGDHFQPGEAPEDRPLETVRCTGGEQSSPEARWKCLVDVAKLNRDSNVVRGGPNFAKFEIVPPVNDAPYALLVVPTPLVVPTRGRSVEKLGRLLYIKNGAPWPSSGDDVAELIRRRPERGEAATVTTPGGTRYWAYSAASYEMDWVVANEGYDCVAAIPLDALYLPLTTLRWEVAGTVAASLLLATALALLLSARMVGGIRAVEAGVKSMARGEWKPLPRLSGDELGGGLVETVNRAAHQLVERTRREEVDNWRRLVRVMSHEINNTLAPVRSVAATLQQHVPTRIRDEDAGEDVTMGLRLIVDRVDSLSGFLGGYAELAKLPAPVLADAPVNTLIEDSVRLVSEAARAKSVALELHLDDATGTAQLDAPQLERALINLLKNAVEAAPTGGVVRVRSLRRADSVELSIEDDGPGIAPDARKNLFVPFYSTKPGGSGVGLALVRQIVLGHGGLVTAEEAQPHGALFRVTLPRKARAAA